MKKLLIGLLTVSLISYPVFAQESQSYLSLGGSLSEEQQSEIKSTFQAEDTPRENIFTIDGDIINEYLNDGSTKADGVYSSSYVTMLPEGSGLTVIILTPDNITKVNQRTYENAAISAGAKDALIQIGSVQPVTGEGALAGVYEIFSQAGQQLDKEAIQTAEKQIKVEQLLLEETDLSADEIATLITKLNIAVIDLLEENKEPTEKEISEVVDNFITKNELVLTEDITDALYQHAIDFAASPVALDPTTKEVLLDSIPDETHTSSETAEFGQVVNADGVEITIDNVYFSTELNQFDDSGAEIVLVVETTVMNNTDSEIFAAMNIDAYGDGMKLEIYPHNAVNSPTISAGRGANVTLAFGVIEEFKEVEFEFRREYLADIVNETVVINVENLVIY